MRVVFMGTPSFAVPSLEALAQNHDVLAVYTRPDAVSGRGRSMRPSAAKQAAISLGLEVHTPAALRDPGEQEALRELGPDVGVVAAYGVILPREVLSAAHLGFVNVHASLLPRWRGAAPIQRAMLAGDPVTGVSIMRMEEGLDTGPYCEQLETDIGAKNAQALTEELAILGADALIRTLDKMTTDTCVWTTQDEERATYAAKVTKQDVRLAPDLTAAELVRRVRASSRQAPARAIVGAASLTVLEAETAPSHVPVGIAACAGSSILLGTAEGGLRLLRVKPEGRNEMDAAAWLRGSSIQEDTPWKSAL